MSSLVLMRWLEGSPERYDAPIARNGSSALAGGQAGGRGRSARTAWLAPRSSTPLAHPPGSRRLAARRTLWWHQRVVRLFGRTPQHAPGGHGAQGFGHRRQGEPQDGDPSPTGGHWRGGPRRLSAQPLEGAFRARRHARPAGVARHEREDRRDAPDRERIEPAVMRRFKLNLLGSRKVDAG